MARPTYSAIAALAGVGTATVERVLNGRGGVRPETVERVIHAARSLDWPGRLPETHRGLLRIEVILVRPETTFFARLSRAFERIAATLDASVSVHRSFLPETDAEAIAHRLNRRDLRRSGLILAVPDRPVIRAALARLRGEGLPIVQIVTRSEPEAPYVGIDNRAAGRSAGLFMARMAPRPGPVVALCHSQIYQVHRDRIAGFSDALARHGDGRLHLDRVLFGQDETQLSGDLLLAALRDLPDLAGLYNAGGQNAALIEVLRRQGRRPFYIGHELTEASTAALGDGLLHIVLDQAPEAQARRAMDLMLNRLGLLPCPVDNPPIRFVTLTAEAL